MTEEYIAVQGGNRITGTVKVSGAKNSVLKLMAACIMAPGISVISNAPDISDVSLMSEVLVSLGATVEREGDVLRIDTTDIDSYDAPYELVVRMRASTAVLGPLLSRFGRAHVAMPGGCKIGQRKLDLHYAGLAALGVDFNLEHGYIDGCAPDGLIGSTVTLNFPSVGATENIMMAAAKAKGKTTIVNAAREPEIVDLADFLNKMGARIIGQGSPVIEIEGVDELKPTTHRTVGDRIEAGTFLAAGALTGGPVRVEGINPSFLEMALRKFEDMGCDVECEDDAITVSRSGELVATDIQTLPHPGFPTDLQAQFMALAAVAKGNSVVSENVFENRFMFADEITRMGADIRIEGHHAFVTGVKRLSGAPVASPDLRGGAALVLAGLVADGETRVTQVGHIDRGYENFVDKFRSLGADITRG